MIFIGESKFSLNTHVYTYQRFNLFDDNPNLAVADMKLAISASPLES